jgi:hypothetical protein
MLPVIRAALGAVGLAGVFNGVGLSEDGKPHAALTYATFYGVGGALVLVACVLTLVIHRQRSPGKPSVDVVDHEVGLRWITDFHTDQRIEQAYFVAVLVKNEGSAEATNVWTQLSFERLNGEPLFDHSFTARWSNAPQPHGAAGP